MEKLIELLNEWSKTAIENKCNWTDVYDEEWVYFLNLFDRDMTMEIEDVISKRNWFIKRLVENDKIDFSKFEYMINIKANKRELYYTKAGFHTEALLMLLSIQDEPIEYLISILK